MSSNFVKGADAAALFEAKMVTLTRLIKAARAVDENGVAADKHTVEVAVEDMDELRAALKELGKS